MVVTVCEREADMTSPVERNAWAFGCEGWPVFREFEAPQGVPDLVFARFSEAAIESRAESPLNGVFASARVAGVLLSLSQRHPRDLGTLAARSGIAIETIRRTLRELGRVAAVERLSGGWIRPFPCPGRLHTAVAIELKKSDWRRALGQAARYRAFAERSLVVLNADTSASALENAFVFERNQLGLATLKDLRHVTMIRNVRSGRPFDPVGRFVAGERLWERLVSGPVSVCALA